MKTATLKPVKPLHPKSPELKYTGGEPEWREQPGEDTRKGRLIGAFSWYNYHYGKKDAKEFMIDWLVRNDRQKDAKAFARVPDSAMSLQAAWLSRMNLMGLVLNEREQAHVNDHVSEQISAALSVREVVKADEPVVVKPNIQDRLREKLSEAAGEIEGMFDDMVLAGAKMSADYKPITILRGMNVAPQMVGEIAATWQRRSDELAEVIAGKNAQLVEGYGNFGKLQLKNLVKFCEQVIADCGSYVQIKKTERAPRKKKPVSPEKLVARFKYLKELTELKLVSEPPTKLIGATEAWLYDSKKRKLVHLVADPHVGSMSIKGTTLIGFDTNNSVQKTLRKPAEQLKALMSASVPNARKFFKDIKSTEIRFNGRGNENLLVLRTK